MKPTDKKQRIIFINLHGNEFLVKTLNKIIFGQSVAIKHKYFLDYLICEPSIEVCSLINKRGLSLSYTTKNIFLQSFRFIEHRITLKKNGIDNKKITVLKNENEIKPEDIVIVYSYYSPTQLALGNVPNATRIICQIHFNTQYSDLERIFNPHCMYNESNLLKYSGMWRHDLSWYKNDFIVIPFVFEDRFKSNKDFKERQIKAVSMGTITYMNNITDFYGDSCAQPARRLGRSLAKERPDLIDSFNFDYLEGQQGKNENKTNNPLFKIIRRLHAKFTGGHQKQYYSFNMVDKYNEYKIAFVGEEIMGIPGIGFVEAMACGCAFIGQTVGYYEDFGLKEGVHYIGYDGTKGDLISKLEYWERPENQERLEKIAYRGKTYVKENFNKEKIAKYLLNSILEAKSNNNEQITTY